MTQTQISQLELARRLYSKIDKEVHLKLHEAKMAIVEIEIVCDHHWPDGRSAASSGFAYSCCDICGAGDW